MSYKIIVGRNESDRALFGDQATVYLGRLYVKMGQTTSLSNQIFLDVARTHVMMICGKRGSGKSYSSSVIAEEIARMNEAVKKNITVLFFDTMGVFWTMKYPNKRQRKLLEEWGLQPQAIDVSIFTPEGYYKDYQKKGLPTDHSFTLRTSELDAADWCNVFSVKLTEPLGVFIEKIIGSLEGEYSIKDIVNLIRKEDSEKKEIKDAAENRFLAAEKWGLFARYGTKIEDLMKAGKVNILDISCYTQGSSDWNVKGLVIGIISRKLLAERIGARKEEELENIQREESYFYEETKEGKPMVWIMIDEAHEFLPKTGKTPATDALVQLLREGRQPGISMILVTQQPGEIHRDVLTQSDIVLSHKLTSRMDIEALNSMNQSYLTSDLSAYINNLPRLRGSAIILDDNSERIYPMRVHPKRSWHGGEAPSALVVKKEVQFESLF